MRILMFLHLPFPPDERVMQEARSLMRGGHEVKLICSRRRGEPAREIIDGLEVIRLKRTPIYLFELAVVLESIRLHRRWPFQVFHKHDLPMSLRTAGRLKRLLGVKIVADLHENWTGMMESAIENPTRYQRWVINGLKREERKFLRIADAVIVVVEEHVTRLRELVPGVERKTGVVPNYTDTDAVDSALSLAWRERKEGGLPSSVTEALSFMSRQEGTIVYFGGLGRHRGVETLIKSIGKLPDGYGALIAGGNPERDYISPLKALASDLGVEGRVHFTGRLEFRHGMFLASRAQIGVVPYMSNPHTENTIPHKVFQYMYLGLPVLASAVAPLKRVVLGSGAGLCFRPGDSDDLAEKALILLRDDELRKEMGKRGEMAVVDRFNWGASEKALLGIYGKLGDGVATVQ